MATTPPELVTENEMFHSVSGESGHPHSFGLGKAQPEPDFSILTSEEKLEYLQFMLSKLDSLVTEANERSRQRKEDKYIQSFESKGEVLTDFSNTCFIDPIIALIQRPIDLSTLYWNVEVVNAVSPSNFWVRSYELLDFLDQTTIELNRFYKDYHAKHPTIGFDNLQLGGFYAVKTDLDNDQPWARCKIVEPFSKTIPIMALLVDSGSLVSVAPENFRPLTAAFCILPVLAYEASLGTADPKGKPRKPCTPEMCLRFQERVNGKGFPSVLRGLTFESGDFKPIKLFLVDTSGEPDKWIHREF